MGLTSSFGAPTILSLLVFLAAATFAFVVLVGFRARESVRRRALRAGISEQALGGRRSLRYSGKRAAQKLIDYTVKHYSSVDSKDVKVLRQRLVQGGIYDPRAAAIFFLSRVVFAVVLGGGGFLLLPTLGLKAKTAFWVFVMIAGVLGYIAPSLYLDRRIARRRLEHRRGFPDLMDLLVVCADAGLSMEASLDRVARELGDGYPSLTANIHMGNLEVRAGQTMAQALDHLGDRLGLEEARAFATLIQQSEELGSSIGDALRVYSDEMRHKRLSRAEEKAYSLPAKLALPMMVCIFPTLFVVILLPVIVKLATGNW
jgi:tight adherence protein C